MVEQTKVTQILSDRLRNQLQGVQTAAQRNQLLKNIVNSERGGNQIDHVNADRLHDKLEGVQKNPVIMDRVHISPEAKALYHAQTSPKGNPPDLPGGNPVDNEQTNKPEAGTDPQLSET
jgi:hypothetical protein